MAGPGQLTVGMLFLGEYRNGLKVWSQPGGPGTIVFPQSPDRQPWFVPDGDGLYAWPVFAASLYAFGCGHRMNCVEVFQAYDEYEQQRFAYICCNQCSYIEEIMPVELYHDQFRTPLVIG